MKSDLQTVQDIPIELRPFSVTPYGDRFVVKNLASNTFIFIGEERHFLLDSLKTPTTMASLVQQYQRKFGKYSYKKVFEFVALLVSASFLTPKSQEAVTSAGLFKPFAPPAPPRILALLPRLAPGKIVRSLANLMDSRIAVGILAMLTCYCTLHLYARQDEFEWLRVHGSFSFGLAVWAVILMADFFLKNVFKYLLLSGKGLDTSGSGVRIDHGIPRYVVKDADILTQGPDSTLKFHLAALLFPSVLSFLAILLFEKTHAGFFGIWSYTGLLVIFLELSPFMRGEFLNGLDRLSGKNRRFETLKNFVHRKFVGRIFTAKSFQLEARLIAYGMYLYSLLWLYGAHFMAKEVLERNLHLLTKVVMTEDSIVERATALAFAGGILFPFFGVVAGVIRLICVNLYTIFEKPLNQIFNWISHVIHQFYGMSKSEISEFLKDIPLFSRMAPEIRSKLAEYMELEYFRPGRTVVWQGKPGDAFYTIYQGNAEVFRERSNGHRTLLASLSAGDSFGEMALIKDEPRAATVKARSALICLVLRKKFFKEFVESCMEDKNQITQLIQWTTLLKNMPMFADLPAEAMARVILEMSERQAQKGEAIIHEGDAAEEFYILRSGGAVVWKDYGKPTARQIATLGAGSYFGEIALFEDSPRTATVTAQELSQILVMPKQAFFNILRSSIFSGIWVEETSRTRREEMSVRS